MKRLYLYKLPVYLLSLILVSDNMANSLQDLIKKEKKKSEDALMYSPRTGKKLHEVSDKVKETTAKLLSVSLSKLSKKLQKVPQKEHNKIIMGHFNIPTQYQKDKKTLDFIKRMKPYIDSSQYGPSDSTETLSFLESEQNKTFLGVLTHNAYITAQSKDKGSEDKILNKFIDDSLQRENYLFELESISYTRSIFELSKKGTKNITKKCQKIIHNAFKKYFSRGHKCQFPNQKKFYKTLKRYPTLLSRYNGQCQNFCNNDNAYDFHANCIQNFLNIIGKIEKHRGLKLKQEKVTKLSGYSSNYNNGEGSTSDELNKSLGTYSQVETFHDVLETEKIDCKFNQVSLNDDLQKSSLSYYLEHGCKKIPTSRPNNSQKIADCPKGVFAELCSPTWQCQGGPYGVQKFGPIQTLCIKGNEKCSEISIQSCMNSATMIYAKDEFGERGLTTPRDFRQRGKVQTR